MAFSNDFGLVFIFHLWHTGISTVLYDDIVNKRTAVESKHAAYEFSICFIHQFQMKTLQW